MKRFLLILTIVSSFCIAAIAAPVPKPEPQYHRADVAGAIVDGYYYDYSTKQIASISLRVYHRKVVAYWNNDVWQTCSVRLQKNETGDTSNDVPEEWRNFSKKLQYKIVLNRITLYLDTENS